MRVGSSWAMSPALKLRTREQQRDALLRTRRPRDCNTRALVECGAQRPLAETQRLLATCNARGDGSGPLDALEQCVRTSPLCRSGGPARRRARCVGPLSQQLERVSDLT